MQWFHLTHSVRGWERATFSSRMIEFYNWELPQGSSLTFSKCEEQWPGEIYLKKVYGQIRLKNTASYILILANLNANSYIQVSVRSCLQLLSFGVESIWCVRVENPWKALICIFINQGRHCNGESWPCFLMPVQWNNFILSVINCIFISGYMYSVSLVWIRLITWFTVL